MCDIINLAIADRRNKPFSVDKGVVDRAHLVAFIQLKLPNIYAHSWTIWYKSTIRTRFKCPTYSSSLILHFMKELIIIFKNELCDLLNIIKYDLIKSMSRRILTRTCKHVSTLTLYIIFLSIFYNISLPIVPSIPKWQKWQN